MHVFGHRGSPGFPRFAENTRSSFEKALAAGADGFELDVRRSGDGVIVVIHDATVDRTTNSKGRVSDLSYDRLKALDVPSFADILDEFGSRCVIHVELKESELADEVAEMTLQRGLARRVVVSAFDNDDNDGASTSSWLDLHRIASKVETALLITSGKLRRLGLNDFIAQANQNQARALHVPRDIISAELVQLGAAANLPVRVWTVNNPAEALTMREIGVEAIFSDVPQECIKALGR